MYIKTSDNLLKVSLKNEILSYGSAKWCAVNVKEQAEARKKSNMMRKRNCTFWNSHKLNQLLASVYNHW